MLLNTLKFLILCLDKGDTIQLYGKEKIRLKETAIQTKEELLMYAAAMLYARNEEFPYEVVMTEEIVKMEMAEISNIVITRRCEGL